MGGVGLLGSAGAANLLGNLTGNLPGNLANNFAVGLGAGLNGGLNNLGANLNANLNANLGANLGNLGNLGANLGNLGNLGANLGNLGGDVGNLTVAELLQSSGIGATGLEVRSARARPLHALAFRATMTLAHSHSLPYPRACLRARFFARRTLACPLSPCRHSRVPACARQRRVRARDPHLRSRTLAYPRARANAAPTTSITNSPAICSLARCCSRAAAAGPGCQHPHRAPLRLRQRPERPQRRARPRARARARARARGRPDRLHDRRW